MSSTTHLAIGDSSLANLMGKECSISLGAPFPSVFPSTEQFLLESF